jgi:hypothetical protein
MLRDWLSGLRKYALAACVALAFNANVVRAGDDDTAELRKLIEEQSKQIEQLKQRLDNGSSEASEAGAATPALPGGKLVIDDAAIKNIVRDYLRENPGAGMPSSVQTGYGIGGPGFVVASTMNPAYKPWDDESKIPFDLRIRGRIQTDYYYYKVNDKINHLTGQLNTNAAQVDNGELMIKRMRLMFQGHAFSPDLRYAIELDGGTRGLAGLVNGNGITGTAGIPGGNGLVTVDHAMRLFQAWVAYDFHPCCLYKGCGCDCCEDTPKYAPTFSLICGKFKPGFSFEQYMGSGNEQFVEYGMTNWYFDSDDDNLATGAGFQVKAAEDRFYAQFMVDNGEETQIANLQMDRLPGVTLMAWYDFGGTWDCDRHVWQLYGDCISDIDWSCNPVLRVGGAAYGSWQDRRSLYGNAELNRIRTLPNGGNVVGVFNGGVPGAGFSIDAVDDYRLEAFVAGKYRGFSILNDWFVRELNNFRGQHVAAASRLNEPILYSVNNQGAGFSTTASGILPSNKAIYDFGQQLQAGYFLIPKKLEVAARWSWIAGESGNIRGNGTFSTLSNAQAAAIGLPTTVAGTAVTYRRYNGAFDNFAVANEYTVGVNYYWRRQNLKWQTDVGYYENNPAAGGASASGFTAGVNGYLLRTQIQLWF